MTTLIPNNWLRTYSKLSKLIQSTSKSPLSANLIHCQCRKHSKANSKMFPKCDLDMCEAQQAAPLMDSNYSLSKFV